MNISLKFTELKADDYGNDPDEGTRLSVMAYDHESDSMMPLFNKAVMGGDKDLRRSALLRWITEFGNELIYLAILEERS